MQTHFHVKKGDEVQVISGNHRGATGKILQVLPKPVVTTTRGFCGRC